MKIPKAELVKQTSLFHLKNEAQCLSKFLQRFFIGRFRAALFTAQRQINFFRVLRTANHSTACDLRVSLARGETLGRSM
jgi:hypothetical protein